MIIKLFTGEFHKICMTLPPTNKDSELHEWLRSIDGIDIKIVNDEVFYCLREESSMQLSSNKRRCTSPLRPSIKQTPKRKNAFQSLYHKNIPAKETAEKMSKIQTPGTSQAKGLSFAMQTPNHPIAIFEGSKVTSTAIKARKKAKLLEDNHVRKNLRFLLIVKLEILFQGCAKIYDVVMIGDDNFLNLAGFDLNFEIDYHHTQRSRIRHCGYCFSGLRISQATEIIREWKESLMRVIINVGSVDIAEGRQLIEMINDLTILLKTCKERKIHPVLTTLAPLPNHLLSNKKSIHEGFNHYLRRIVLKSHSVIDLHRVMVTNEGVTDLDCYQTIPRRMSGSRQFLVMWNKTGRKRIFSMIIKNLGHALVYSNHLGTLT